MARTPKLVIVPTAFDRVDPTAPLTRAETCTTADCTAPRIRLNALKCSEHELVYRAAAKVRAAARKAAAAKAAKPVAKAAKAKAAKVATAPANVAPDGLRTVRPPQTMAADNA